MKKLLLSLVLFLGGTFAAQAQVPCVGVGGVNTVPVVGVSCQQEPAVATYAATAVGMVPPASATDLACLKGAANIVIRVQEVRISGSAGTLITTPVVIMKHASLDSGGTPNTGTALPVIGALDSNFGTAKATTNSWSAVPTINDSSPLPIGAQNVVLQVTSAAGSNQTSFAWDARNYSAAPTLRKATEEICINLQGVSINAGVVAATFRWTEASQ